MPVKCSICEHPERHLIEGALIDGESLRGVASRFGGVGKSSLARHKEHLGGGEAGAALIEEVAEEEETTMENQARLITELQGKRETLSRELRETDDLLQLCDKREKASHARTLMVQARALAEEAFGEARAEEQARLELELAELLPRLEERRAALEAVQQLIPVLEAEQQECLNRWGPNSVPEGLVRQIRSAGINMSNERTRYADVNQRITQVRSRLSAGNPDL